MMVRPPPPSSSSSKPRHRLRLPLLLVSSLGLSATPVKAFHHYLAEAKYCHLTLEPDVRIMGRPVQPSPLRQPVLITRTSDGTTLKSGQVYVPGEVLQVGFNASALPDEGNRRRLTWVAEASLLSSLLHSVDDPALDAALGESSRTVCEARGVARAVPATGGDHVLWRMPPAGAEEGSSGVDVGVVLAYAWRYGTVYVTERAVLRAPSAAAGGGGEL